MGENYSTIVMLERRVAREIKSRKQSEKILNKKSLELYYTNLALIESNQELDKRVQERTRELEIAKQKAEHHSAINERVNDRFRLAMLASTAGIWEKNITDNSW